jgi:hypothetical protein
VTSSQAKGATNRDVQWCILKRRKKWRASLEQNTKLVKFNDDHLEIEKTHIHTGAMKGRSLVLTGQKPTLVRGGRRGTV